MNLGKLIQMTGWSLEKRQPAFLARIPAFSEFVKCWLNDKRSSSKPSRLGTLFIILQQFLVLALLLLLGVDTVSAKEALNATKVEGQIWRRNPGEFEAKEFGRVSVNIGDGKCGMVSTESGLNWEFFSDNIIELYVFRYPKQEIIAALEKTNRTRKPLHVQEQAYIGNSGQLSSLRKLDASTDFVRLMLIALSYSDQPSTNSRILLNALPATLRMQFGTNYEIGVSLAKEINSQVKTLSFFSVAKKVHLQSVSFPVDMSHYPGRFLCYKLIWEVPADGELPRRFKATMFSPYFDSYTTPHRDAVDVMDLGSIEFELLSQRKPDASPNWPTIDKEILVRDYRYANGIDNPVAFATREKNWPTNKAYEILNHVPPKRKGSVVTIRLIIIFTALVPLGLLFGWKSFKQKNSKKSKL